MSGNVAHRPRPRSQRPAPEGLGFYVRVGHAVYQRAREIERLSDVPRRERAAHYLDQYVRRVSDDVAQMAAFPVREDALARGLQGKQREMSRYRQTIAHLVENDPAPSVAVAPTRRQARKGG